MKRFLAVFLAVWLLFIVSCGDTTKDDGPVVDADDIEQQEDSVAELDEMYDDENADDDDSKEEVFPENPVVVTPDHGFHLDVKVDLKDVEERKYHIDETISFIAPEDGNVVQLFGEEFDVHSASFPYEYDGHTFQFATGEFSKDDEVEISISFSFIEKPERFGLRMWESGGSNKVVGPFTEPDYTSFWAMVPQSKHYTNKDHDHNVVLNSVDLEVVVPDESWSVVGPGVLPVKQERKSWKFSYDIKMPLYALSFAAAPDYELYEIGKSKSGVTVYGMSAPEDKALHIASYSAGITTIDWMEEHIGSYDFGDTMSFVTIPDFPGGMEHVTVIYMGEKISEDESQGKFVTVHEAVHHWWGDNVRFADFNHFWMVEGFDEWTTNYNLMVAVEGEEAFAKRKKAYRKISGLMCGTWNTPLRLEDGETIENYWDNLQFFYYYGASFLHMVDQRLKRDYDMELLPLFKEWFELNRFKGVTTEEFLDFLIEKTEKSDNYWQKLFNQWVYKGTCPGFTAKNYSFDGTKVSFDLDLVNGSTHTLSDVEVHFLVNDEVKKTTFSLTSDSKKATISLDTEVEPDAIAIDPEWYYIFYLTRENGWQGPEVEVFFGKSKPMKALKKLQEFRY